MSWRIERSDGLTVLRELPSGWAQSCVTKPSRDLPAARLLAVLEETRRVLRSDGTLWLTLPPGGASPAVLHGLEDAGWLTAGRHASQRVPRGVLLFTKQPEYLLHPRPPLPSSAKRRFGPLDRGYEGCSSTRRAFCVAAPGVAGVPEREVIEWCVLSSTVSRACGLCGTPWQPRSAAASRGERWRRVCVHVNGRGRSLVIDPFCESAATGLVAQRRGRDFLGIVQSCDAARAIRRRLAAAGREAQR
jgi:hypothetical protein